MAEREDRQTPLVDGDGRVRETAALHRRQASIPWRNIGLLPNFRADLADVEGLAASIEQRGLIAPLVVRADPGGTVPYQLVAGYRRHAAWALLHADEPNAEVLCEIIEGLSEDEAFELMFLENVQRQPLEPMEVARGLQQLLDRSPRWRAATLARSLGLRVGYVQRYLRMLELPEPVQEQLAAGDLSFTSADLLRVAARRGDLDEEGVTRYADAVASGQMTPGQLREAVRPVVEYEPSDDEPAPWADPVDEESPAGGWEDEEGDDRAGNRPPVGPAARPGATDGAEEGDVIWEVGAPPGSSGLGHLDTPLVPAAAARHELTDEHLEAFVVGRLASQLASDAWLSERGIGRLEAEGHALGLAAQGFDALAVERRSLARDIIAHDPDPYLSASAFGDDR